MMASTHLVRLAPRRLQKLSPGCVFAFQQRLASHVAPALVNEHGHAVKKGEVYVEDQHHGGHGYVPAYKERIGDREIVGYGWSSEPYYGDSYLWPYPAIRFKRPDQRYKELHQKELGDWKSLTKEEKKELYRYSFCETVSEFNYAHGNWKRVIGILCFWFSVSLWAFVALKKIYPPLPESFTDENRLAMLKRMIDMRVNPIDGLGSKWDYEKGRWKE